MEVIESNIFRWYRPGAGRYSQTDPIALSSSLNLYEYANFNPLVFADDRGLAAITVEQVQEKTYNSLKEYQKANPCNAPNSFSCTERVLEDFGCICSCKGDGYGMDVQANVRLRYHLAGPPAGSNLPPAFFWSGYRKHEDLHTNHLKKELTKYAKELEKKRYGTIEECNLDCGKAIVGFKSWLNNWAVASNKKYK